MAKSTVQVLGSGCKNCKTLHENVLAAVKDAGLDCDVEYITDLEKIMSLGVMSMPALAVNGKVVSSGKVLSVSEVEKAIRAEDSKK